MKASAPHVVAIPGRCRIPILAVEPLGRCLHQERRAGDVVHVEPRRPRNPVLEEAAPCPIHLAIAEYVPLLERPPCVAYGRGGHSLRAHTPAVGKRPSRWRVAVNYESC